MVADSAPRSRQCRAERKPLKRLVSAPLRYAPTNHLNGQFHRDNQAASGPLSRQNCRSARHYLSPDYRPQKAAIPPDRPSSFCSTGVILSFQLITFRFQEYLCGFLIYFKTLESSSSKLPVHKPYSTKRKDR